MTKILMGTGLRLRGRPHYAAPYNRADTYRRQIHYRRYSAIRRSRLTALARLTTSRPRRRAHAIWAAFWLASSARDDEISLKITSLFLPPLHHAHHSDAYFLFIKEAQIDILTLLHEDAYTFSTYFISYNIDDRCLPQESDDVLKCKVLRAITLSFSCQPAGATWGAKSQARTFHATGFKMPVTISPVRRPTYDDVNDYCAYFSRARFRDAMMMLALIPEQALKDGRKRCRCGEADYYLLRALFITYYFGAAIYTFRARPHYY